MRVQSGGRSFSLCFMTATWGPDAGHFHWLRRSLECAGMAHIPHVVVVQTEDYELFEPYAKDGVQLLRTAEVLPPDVEQRRIAARRRVDRYGRFWTKFCASLNKRFGLCDWVRYTGWHTQQIVKLMAAATLPYDIMVVIDSDMLIARPFDLSLFVKDGRVVLFEKNHVTPQTPGLQWRWHVNASRLLNEPVREDVPADGAVGTPYVFERATVQRLQGWLEREYQRPWYEALLSQPVYGWSEFHTYSLFASTKSGSNLTRCRNPHVRDLGTLAARMNYEQIMRDAWKDPAVFFLSLPSDRRGSRRWSIESYQATLTSLLSS